jgi:hypothetical protein
MSTQEYRRRIEASIRQEYLYLDFWLGTGIKEAADIAWLRAIQNPMQLPVMFKFNGVELIVHRDTRVEDIVTLYHARLGKK